MPLIVGGAILGGSLLSGLFGASSADKAAKAQTRAANAANAEQRRQFDLQRSDLAPWRQAGTRALPFVSGAYGIGTPEENQAAMDAFMKASPDYNFGLEQGQRAVQGALTAGGMGRYGGGALKALTRYGQDYATQRLGEWRNGVAGIAGVGQNAVNAGNQASQNFSNAYGANTRAAGDARASSYMAQGQAWSGALNDTLQMGAYGYGKGWFGGGGSSPPPASSVGRLPYSWQ